MRTVAIPLPADLWIGSIFAAGAIGDERPDDGKADAKPVATADAAAGKAKEFEPL